MASMVGAPVVVRTGFVRKIKINVPWSEILSKPCEIYLDDVHVICDTPAKFDPSFIKKIDHKNKMKIFEELLKSFKDQQLKEEDKAKEDQETYLQRIKAIVK